MLRPVASGAEERSPDDEHASEAPNDETPAEVERADVDVSERASEPVPGRLRPIAEQRDAFAKRQCSCASRGGAEVARAALRRVDPEHADANPRPATSHVERVSVHDAGDDARQLELFASGCARGDRGEQSYEGNKQKRVDCPR